MPSHRRLLLGLGLLLALGVIGTPAQTRAFDHACGNGSGTPHG